MGSAYPSNRGMLCRDGMVDNLAYDDSIKYMTGRMCAEAAVIYILYKICCGWRIY